MKPCACSASVPARRSPPKDWASDPACLTVDRCLQLSGGYGDMKEYPIAHLFADTRVLRIFAGANEVMKELVARSL
nr:acyl-CoA dehydrogenase family protein [Corallococcus macrosporus]